MATPRPTIGIIGAGKLGTVLANLFLAANYPVSIAGSGDVSKISLSTSILTPGAHATTTHDAASTADIVILALPLGKIASLQPSDFANKIVIDAANYWWEVDGNEHDLIHLHASSSEMVQAHLAESTVVKALSHMGYHHLHDEAKPGMHQRRKAIAIASDSPTASKKVQQLIEDIGFDTVLLPSLHSGNQLEPGHPAFGANVSKSKLKTLVQLH